MKYLPYLFLVLGIYLAFDSFLMLLSSLGIVKITFQGMIMESNIANWDFLFKVEKISLLLAAIGKFTMSTILIFLSYVMKIQFSLDSNLTISLHNNLTNNTK